MLLLVAKLADTLGTDVLFFELTKTLRVAAKMANGCILCQNNTVSLCENLYGVCVGYAELPTNFLRDNHSAKLIDMSYNACGFHLWTSLSA